MQNLIDYFKAPKKEKEQSFIHKTDDGKEFCSVKYIARCCIKLKISLPAGDIITLLRIIWSRRFDGPFVDASLRIDEFPKDVRQIEVYLVPDEWSNTKNKFLSSDLEQALWDLMKNEEANLGEYSLPYLQLDVIAANNRASILGGSLEPGDRKAFYAKMFDKSLTLEDFNPSKENSKYLHWNSGDKSIGGLYEIGLVGIRTQKSWDLLKTFALRCWSEPLISGVVLMPLDLHLTESTLLRRVIIRTISFNRKNITVSGILGYLIESFHLLLSEKEFSEILDTMMCDTQSSGEASIGMCKAYPGGLKINKSLEGCIFTISGADIPVKWGPNGAFTSEPKGYHPLWNGDYNYLPPKGQVPLWDLLIVREPTSDEKVGSPETKYVIDYGWYDIPGYSGKRIVTNPAYLEASITDIHDNNPSWVVGVPGEAISFLDSEPDEDYIDSIITSELEYTKVLCRYGFYANTLVNVSYE